MKKLAALLVTALAVHVCGEWPRVTLSMTYPLDCERVACAIELPMPELMPAVYRERCGNCLPGYGNWTAEYEDWSDWPECGGRKLSVQPLSLLTAPVVAAPVVTTMPGIGLRPPLASTSSASITREAPIAHALAAPTRTPYAWLEAHCGVDEDHPDVQYPPCGPGRMR